MKKFLSFIAVLALAGNLVYAAETAEKAATAAPETAPVEPAPPELPPVPAEKFFAALPEVLATYEGGQLTKAQFLKEISAQMPTGIPAQIKFEMIAPQLPQIFEQMIMTQVLEVKAEAAGFKPSAEIAKKALMEEVKRIPAEMLQQIQAREKKSIDQVIEAEAARPEVQKQAAIAAFMQSLAAKAPVATEKDAKEYYDKNTDQFKTPADPADGFRASHILVAINKEAGVDDAAALKKINEINAKLKADPAQFETLAAQFSDCPSKQRGGSLGAFKFEDMVPEFSNAVKGLKVGEITAAPVKTQFGYHLIRRDALQKEVITTYEAVKTDLVNFLNQRNQQMHLSAIRDTWLKEAKIVVKYQAPAPVIPPAPAAPAAPAAK